MLNKNYKKTAILNVLKDQSEPISSFKTKQLLSLTGLEYNERTIRLHLKKFDEVGLTVLKGRKGRIITEAGLAELRSSQITKSPGYLLSKTDQMIYSMNFDLPMRSGTVIVNASIVDPYFLSNVAEKICDIFQNGFGMGKLMTLVGPEEKIGEFLIPKNKIAFCTVSSNTINGISAIHGIPITSRFGGLLRIKEGNAFRFEEVINFDSTSIDPLEAFIRSGMTDHYKTQKSGDRLIVASFKEIPGKSRSHLLNISQQLQKIGLGSIMKIGLPSRSLLKIPVSYGQIGLVVCSGLNPMSIVEEREDPAFSRILSGLLAYERLFHFKEFRSKLQKYL